MTEIEKRIPVDRQKIMEMLDTLPREVRVGLLAGLCARLTAEPEKKEDDK